MWQPTECCYHCVLHRDVRGSTSFVPSQCWVWVRWMLLFASCWPFGLGCVCYWWCCLQNGCLERLFFWLCCCRCCVHNDWFVCAVVGVVSTTTVLTGLFVLLKVLCPEWLFWIGCLCVVFLPWSGIILTVWFKRKLPFWMLDLNNWMFDLNNLIEWFKQLSFLVPR